jgi:sirohydrochlorin ferrochelatase
MQDPGVRLLVVAHGTTSPAGAATTRNLVRAVAAARPGLEVELCFLDVDHPRLADALGDEPTVAVPLLLSTGYHVQTDIPAAVAGHPRTRVARHLGPDPLLVDALVDRLPDHDPAAATVLVGTGSSRDEAAAELAAAGRLLADRLGTPVQVATMADDLPQLFASLPGPARVATYLLAEGRFAETLLRAAADAGGDIRVAAPIGVHPALVELVLARYEQARGAC